MKNLKLYEVYGLNVVLKMYVLQSHKRQKNCHDGRNHKSTGWVDAVNARLQHPFSCLDVTMILT